MKGHESEIPKPLEELTGPERERKAAIARVTTSTLAHLTTRLLEEGFDWLLPVVLSKSTDPLWPDPGASIEKRIEVEIYEETVRATLSMIIHKMVACSLLYDRLFILSPNLRIERRERGTTGVHAYEFTQLDFEIREATAEDVRRLVEDLVVGLLEHLRSARREELDTLGRYADLRPPSPPWPVRDRWELEEEWGGAWADRAAQAAREPFWVVNIPREFYDYEDPETGRWDNYDLFLPGHGEVLSGARREWEHDKIQAKMVRDGVEPERYALLLRLAREGRLRPTAGAGIGVERLLAWIAGARHVGEVQPFPKVPGLVYDL